MTTKERVVVRQALLDAGFDRIDSTPDNGEGRYSELWRSKKDESSITLKWDKKTVDIMDEFMKEIARLENTALKGISMVGAANYADRECDARHAVVRTAEHSRSRVRLLLAGKKLV